MNIVNQPASSLVMIVYNCTDGHLNTELNLYFLLAEIFRHNKETFFQIE